MDVRELVAYHHWLWSRFADFYEDECSWDELSANHETSHNTIANVSMHAANMEDWWLHYVVPGKEWDGPAWDGAKSVKDVAKRLRDVEKKTAAWLETVTDADLKKKRTVLMGDDKIETTLEDVLVECVNEATHHRGEVLAMLWRNDKEPPYASFLEFRQSR